MKTFVTIFLILFALRSFKLMAQDSTVVVCDTISVVLKSDQIANRNESYQLYECYDLTPQTFSVFGFAPVPGITGGAIGYPHSQIDVSYFFYKQPKINRAYRLVIDGSWIYSLYDEEPFGPGATLKFNHFLYKKARLDHMKAPKSMVVARDLKSKTNYVTSLIMPISRSSGFNYGLFLSRQYSISETRFLSLGANLGFVRNNFVKIKTQLEGFRSAESFNRNRLFYANLEVTFYNHRFFASNGIHLLRAVPLGLHFGWHFLNGSNMGYYMSYNLEFGFRSPIVTQVNANDLITPLFYISYRIYFGRFDELGPPKAYNSGDIKL